jgi:predicted glycosyltransferase
MRLLIEAHHPAHIHFFKHAIREWIRRGDEVLLVGRDRDVMRQLLAAYDYIPHEIGSAVKGSNRFPLREMLERQTLIGRRVLSFRPDVVLSLMGSYTQSARLRNVPNVVFTDSEFQHFNHRIAHPFATRIYTPECFWKDLGPKQRRYAGYHELAFLHPRRFTPNPAILDKLGVEAGGYLVIRVSAWDTLHDIGQTGFGEALDELMQSALAKYRVWLVPEGGRLPARWAEHRLPVAPHEFHDALAHARFVVTEGASTAAEAACLGVPSIYVNSTSRGYLDDMHRRYGLVSTHADSRSALQRLQHWLDAPPDVAGSRRARDQLLKDHIDVTSYVVKEIDQLVKRAG